MSTTYPGDPTATQAPSDPPVNGNAPKVVLPSDGDADNAASVAQAFKVLADFIAWLLAPFAKASAWAQAIFAFRNARLQTRFGVDHFGFPNGNLISWDENWSDNALQTVTANGNTVASRWTFHSDGGPVSGGNLHSQPPQYTSSDNNGSRFLTIGSVPGGGRADIQLNAAWWSTVFTDDITVGMFWSFEVPPTASANCTFVMGFTSDFQPANAITDGCYIFKTPTDTNWQLKCVSVGGGGFTTIDTGIPAASGSFHRAALVLVGANQSDDSTARALLFIDGAIVGDITAHLPYTSGGAGAGLPLSPIFGVVTAAGASTIELRVGPVRYRQSMYAGDALT